MSISCPEKEHFSNLKHMALSPAHYRYACDHGVEETDEMRLGTAVHSMVLGGAPVVIYEGKRIGQDWKAFASAHAKDVILKPEAFERAAMMAASLEAHPAAAELLATPHRQEFHIDWERGGRACCSRLDMWATSARWIADLKVTRTANPDWFAKIAIRMQYHAQLEWYLQAATWLAESLPGAPVAPPRDAYILAVESKPPYPVVVWKVTERALEAGRKANTLWFERRMVCAAENHWPGYTDAVQPLDVADEEQELVFEEEGE